MATIKIRGLKVWGHHGVFEAERKEGQFFLIDLKLRLKQIPLKDQLEETVDYTEIFKEIVVISENNSFRLIEKFAEAIAKQLLEKFAKVSMVKVRVRKRLRGADADLDWVAALVCREQKDFRRE